MFHVVSRTLFHLHAFSELPYPSLPLIIAECKCKRRAGLASTSGWGTRDDAVDDSCASGVHGAAGFGGLLLSINLSILKDTRGIATILVGTRARTQRRGHSILTIYLRSLPGSARMHPPALPGSARIHPPPLPGSYFQAWPRHVKHMQVHTLIFVSLVSTTGQLR